MALLNGTARLNVALVGAGSMGSFHARVISQSERAVLGAVIDPNEEAGQALATRYGSAWYPDVTGIGRYDAVVLAAATEVHHDLALTILDAGRPLLVEKPVTADLASTVAILDTAEAAGLPIMCGFVERFNPAILTVQALVNSPVHVYAARHSPYVPRIRTGVGWDLLVHDIDACLRFVKAELTSVRGGFGYVHPASQVGAEDIAESVLGFSNGAVAAVSASRIGQRKIRSITVGEIDRSIEIDLLRRDVTIYRHVGWDSAPPDGLGYRQQTIIEIPELVTNREPLAAQLDHFIDLIEGSVDADEERVSILPPHQTVAQLASQSPAAPEECAIPRQREITHSHRALG